MGYRSPIGILSTRFEWHRNRKSCQILGVLLVYLTQKEVGRHMPIDGAKAEVVLTVEYLGALNMNETRSAKEAQV
jgi:hypothetical protein